jgi:hypothetical protein
VCDSGHFFYLLVGIKFDAEGKCLFEEKVTKMFLKLPQTFLEIPDFKEILCSKWALESLGLSSPLCVKQLKEVRTVKTQLIFA